MREIKFRAFDTIDKKWLFGYEYPNLGGFNIVGEVTLMGELNQVSLDRWNDVAIMQFTGLKDIHEIEIYEGDIVKSVKNNTNWEVKFGEYSYRDENLAIGYYMENSQDGISFPLATAAGSIERIGNVHENPELL